MLLVYNLLQTLTTRHHLMTWAATAFPLDGAQAEDAYLRTSNLFTPLVFRADYGEPLYAAVLLFEMHRTLQNAYSPRVCNLSTRAS
jgi:hypothetical protein